MLELKEVKVAFPQGGLSRPVTLVMRGGSLVCLTGPAGSGKSLLLQSIMGFWPVAEGYVTIDGELVSPGSSSYFRQFIGYVPQQLPETVESVGSLYRTLLGLQVNHPAKLGKKQVLDEWRKLGIDTSFYSQPWSKVPVELRQLMLLAGAELVQRPIYLIDEPVQNEVSAALLHRLSERGAEVVYTSRNNMIACERTINL